MPADRPRITYNFLDRQFGPALTESILADLRALVRTGAFTIGPPVLEFERRFGELFGFRHVVGTNTGTDALILALRAVGVSPGDEVVTQVNTFFATVGAIVAVGARPRFVDVDESLSLDHGLIEAAITPRTKAIIPVYWTGLAPEMPRIEQIAGRRGLRIIEDACPAVGARYDDRPAGTFGAAAAFSLHPLKPLHVWGDGGAIGTNDDAVAQWLRLYRNHGMINRDEIAMWGVNARLQTVQAVVANRILDQVKPWIDRRSRIAVRLDAGLRDVPEVTIPPRPGRAQSAHHLYIVLAERRDELLAFLDREGVEAKIHYPVPLHLQPAARDLGYARGDFPVAEAQAARIVTLPNHQFLTDDEVDRIIDTVRRFYRKCRHPSP